MDRIQREEQVPGLVRDEVTGLLFYDNGAEPSSVDVVNLVERDRERRMRYIAGEIDEP